LLSRNPQSMFQLRRSRFQERFPNVTLQEILMCASSIFVESKNQMILEYKTSTTSLRREVNVLLVRPLSPAPTTREHDHMRTHACACLSFQRDEEASAQHKSNKTETHRCSPQRLIWQEDRLTGVSPVKGQSRPNEGHRLTSTLPCGLLRYPDGNWRLDQLLPSDAATMSAMNSDVLTVKPFTAAPPLSPPVDASETRLRGRRTQNMPFNFVDFCSPLLGSGCAEGFGAAGLGRSGWGRRREGLDPLAQRQGKEGNQREEDPKCDSLGGGIHSTGRRLNVFSPNITSGFC
ncbi:hypothetical protein B0H14DRAFT_2894321, partial [Mycena olivaceomarginata]